MQDDSESGVQHRDANIATDSEGSTETTRQRRGRLLDRVEHKTEVGICLIWMSVSRNSCLC